MKRILQTLLRSAALVPMVALVVGVAVPMQPAYAAGENCDIHAGIDSAGCSKGETQSESLEGQTGVFRTVTNILLFIIGAVSVIMLVIGGVRYTISGGDQNQVTAAKNTILYAIIGIVVAIMAYAAVNFVIQSFLQGA
ncbi:hypothetical protein CR983_01635 [Candidatus Saccharibacteria bacterium]|nr:MAG: hypothetical protein CR983_01635 [Candidatus Saccharibacteria bacterium]